MSRNRSHLGFLRTTAVGGLIFLLPLIVIGALIGQVVPIIMTIAESLAEILPGFIKTTSGIAALIGLSIAVLLLLCFAAGLLARWSLGKRLSAFFERNLLLLFPKYAILKEQMADTIGGDQTKPQLKPVVVEFSDFKRIGFETERDVQGQYAAVYLPGSPDAWAGEVVLVALDRIKSLEADFGETVATCEQLGRGSSNLLQRPRDNARASAN